MKRTLSIAGAALLLAGTISIRPEAVPQTPAQAAWPPSVQAGPVESPPLSPDAEMKTFAIAPGYQVQLVASEPMIQDPIAIDFDPDGRMWAIELTGYMNTIAAANEHEPLCRIVVLQDADDDGKMDSRTVFAEGLVLPRALKVLDKGVLVGEPPNLWLMKDTNGDLKADTKELVTDKYGTREGNVEHNANGLTWALDNWMYTSETDIYLRLKNGRFDVQKTPSRGQWGNSQDDAGRIYRNTNESVLHVDVVPTPYYGRNPSLVRTRGSYESLEGDANEVNTVWPIHATRGVNRGYQNGVLRPDGTLAAYTSVAAPLVYRGDRLPKDVYGNVFVVEPAGNLVSRIVLSDDGTTLKAKKAYERAEFLASTDERFRPVNLSNAPDGTLYLVDMYRGIIQHRGFITEYLRDQITSRHLEQPIGYGRIYRIVHTSTRRDAKPAMSKATTAQLIAALSHPNGWRRDTAQRLIVERADKAGVPALQKLAASAPEPRTRLHALWTLDGIDAITPADVLKALDDSSRDVRTSAVRLSERWLSDPASGVQKALLAHITDSDWSVRRQLAASLGAGPAEWADPALFTLLERSATDPVTVDAALSGIAGREQQMLERLYAATNDTPEHRTTITMLAATIMRGRRDASIQTLFDTVADTSRPAWQRSAILAAAENLALNTPLPGTVARTRTASADAPCPTCPGGRGGPGGAPAFPAGRTGAAAPAPAAGRGRGGPQPPALDLSREPSLSKVVSEGGELGPRASAVLARIGWPGKPGEAVAAPLSSVEQARFDAGQQVYHSLCEACHQPDGRGREKLAPSLVGSELALAPDTVPIRILINGKEGSVGLMPPLGTTLTDDQVAAVLTYVRHAWGQAAAPVTPDRVKEIRAETASRTRPWTNDELLRLANPGR